MGIEGVERALGYSQLRNAGAQYLCANPGSHGRKLSALQWHVVAGHGVLLDG